MAPMQNRLMVPQKTPLLLDLAPGAAAAYSLRQLSNSYTGPVVTVRRSTDSAEADFTANEIDNGDLAAWCMGGDGFVKQWWSQTGSNHATQTTAGYQPKIVSAGVVILEGGKPTVQFDGTDDYFATAGSIGVLGSSARSSFSVQKPIVVTSGSAIFSLGGPVAGAGTLFDVSPEYAVRVSSGYSLFGGGVSGTLALMSVVSTSTTTAGIRGFLDGAAKSPTVASQTINTASGLAFIGASTQLAPTRTNFFTGTISELIIYPRDMTAERQLIEGNMAWYF